METAAHGTRIDGVAAWRTLAATGAAHWTANAERPGFATTAHGRIARGLALPAVRPKFALRDDDTFFCIGSCFARNIEEHLLYRGLAVPSKAIGVPRAEWPARPNGFLNKFTTASILNELRWALGVEAYPQSSLVGSGEEWSDLQLAPGVAPVTRGRALERRLAIARYFDRVRAAGVVIVTLGLTETWYDELAGVYLNTPPTLWAAQREPGRFTVVATEYGDNRARLEEIVQLLALLGRTDVRVVLTVSPVPMSQTFTGEDVLTANAYSKATLRAVAQDVARDRESVQYYPSYDAVVMSDRRTAYSIADELHVRDGIVEAVTSHFLSTFGIARERPHPEFIEVEYLAANPDVHDAIAAGSFGSGYEHWLAFGRSEGRALRTTRALPYFLDPGSRDEPDAPAQPVHADETTATLIERFGRSPLVPALRERDIVLTVTPGRSGTLLLAVLLARVLGVHAEHEPAPRANFEMRPNLADPVAGLRWLVSTKLPVIAASGIDTYVETSHLYCKGFIEHFFALGLRPRFIILRRDASAVARSMFQLGSIPWRTRDGRMVWLDPSDAGTLPFAGWQEAGDYELCYWYALEMERRQAAYREHFLRDAVPFVDVLLDELTDWEAFGRVSAFVDPACDPQPWRGVFDAIVAVNQHPRNVTQPGKRDRELPDDVAELERRVRRAAGLTA